MQIFKIKKLLILLLLNQVLHAAIPKDLGLVDLTTANSPLAFVSPLDGSGRMYIVEQAGIIKLFENNVTSEFLDIADKITTSHADQGLLGAVFDPNFSNNGYFYVNYVRNGGVFDNGVTVIERYHVVNNLVDENSAFIIMEVDQYQQIHNGGTMHFGEDGYLYIAMGDGGGREDPENYSQNLSELLGKMLRIDVNPDIIFRNGIELENKCGNVANYNIVAHNPFINDINSCGEIYLYGLRSPWKWSFDKLTQDIFIGDVGQESVEEISYISADSLGGENLGWSCKEGNLLLLPERCPDDITTLTDPIISYNHSSSNTGNSIVGGYRYRGSVIPELYGTYIYTDTISGEVWFAELIDGEWVTFLWDQSLNFVVSFGEDELGNLYTVSINGSIKKFVIKE